MRARACYRAYLARDGLTIVVFDLKLPGTTTVTNDAAAVVAELRARFGLEGRRIVYRDTDDVWDELMHDGERFLAFAPVREKLLERALARMAAGC